jgi:hypothetical protein
MIDLLFHLEALGTDCVLTFLSKQNRALPELYCPNRKFQEHTAVFFKWAEQYLVAPAC